jgi:hypothetical protein
VEPGIGTTGKGVGRPRTSALPSPRASALLRAAMQAARFTSVELARRLSVSEPKVARWRNGTDPGPSSQEAADLAGVLGDVELAKAWEWPDAPRADGRHRVGLVPPAADRYRVRDIAPELGSAGCEQVLVGLGGGGKTQMAARCACRLWDSHEVRYLIWVQAGSRATIIDGYAAAWSKIGSVAEPDNEKAAIKLLEVLQTTDSRWLVVLDDLVDAAAVHSLMPPRRPLGSTVVTTRRTDAARPAEGRAIVQVGSFTAAEALAYFRDKLADRPELLDGAADLVVALGGLPLALAQAVAYQLDEDLTCAQYLGRLDQRGLLGLELDGLPDDQNSDVAGTWTLSLQRADELAPAGLATPTLRLASLLDPDGVPEAFFQTSAVAQVLAVASGRIDGDDAHDALRCLRRLSLADVEPGRSGLVRVHALVQRVTRERIPADVLPALRRSAADALVEVWSAVGHERESAARLRANAAVLLRGDDTVYRGAVHPLIFRLGKSLGEVGGAEAAADHFAHAQQTATGAGLRAGHPDMLHLRREQMYWLGQAGHVTLARELADPLVDDFTRELGATDIATLETRLYRARWVAAEDPAAAVAELDQLARELSANWGPRHRETLTARNDHAHFLGRSGDHAGAAEEFRRVAAERSALFGPVDHDTLIARNGYGFWLGEAGEYDRAVAVLAPLVEDCRAHLGPEHEFTLGSHGNLIVNRGRLGDVAGQVGELAAVCEKLRRYCGERNPRTLRFEGILREWR